jgi:hypothetical protein
MNEGGLFKKEKKIGQGFRGPREGSGFLRFLKSADIFVNTRLLLYKGLRSSLNCISPERRPVRTILLKSEKFEMGFGRLAPALDVAEGHTVPF